MTDNNTEYIQVPKTYSLLHKQMQFIKAIDDKNNKEILFSGGYGSAKSSALVLAILKEIAIHPDSQVLLCRKTYTSLRRSTLITLKELFPQNTYTINKMDQNIKILGSNAIIHFMGVEDILKVRSMNLSFIAVDEANELDLSDWQELLGRLRNLNGSRQLIAATNPAGPSHFLYERFFVDTHASRKVISATSLENKYLPKDYIDNLKTLPPELYSRFVLGEWVALENIIYKEFSRNIHLKVREEGEFIKYYLGVDFGFTNPTALLLIGMDGDNNLHILKEYKKSGMLISKIVDICENWHRYQPEVIVDPSAPALIAEMQQRGFSVKKADNDVEAGISRVQDYLYRRKLTIDPKCIETIKEIENYIYDKNGKPIKINDHMCFVAGTKVLTNEGYKNIEDIRINDLIFDGNLYNKVTNTLQRCADVSLYRINNKFLICTKDHPVFINGVKLPIGEVCKLFKDKTLKELLKKLNLKEEPIEGICITVIINTLPADAKELIKDQEFCIETCGLVLLEKYLKDTMSTIKTLILRTTILVTLNLLKVVNIIHYTPKNFIKNILNLILNKWLGTRKSVEDGMDQKKDENYIDCSQTILETDIRLPLNVQDAVKQQNMTTCKQGQAETTSVPPTAKISLTGIGGVKRILLKLYVQYAELLSRRTNTQKKPTVLDPAQEKLEVINALKIGHLPVYNITVDNSHRYFANNILVSNCDAIRYITSEVLGSRGSNFAFNIK